MFGVKRKYGFCVETFDMHEKGYLLEIKSPPRDLVVGDVVRQKKKYWEITEIDLVCEFGPKDDRRKHFGVLVQPVSGTQGPPRDRMTRLFLEDVFWKKRDV